MLRTLALATMLMAGAVAHTAVLAQATSANRVQVQWPATPSSAWSAGMK